MGGYELGTAPIHEISSRIIFRIYFYGALKMPLIMYRLLSCAGTTQATSFWGFYVLKLQVEGFSRTS